LVPVRRQAGALGVGERHPPGAGGSSADGLH
jgi:hypothetical protein